MSQRTKNKRCWAWLGDILYFSMNQRIIGLTGGIGTGKTTVANYLETVKQLPILDADQLAREAVAKNSPILDAIHKRYGDKILQTDGSLNRSGLGEIIFNHPTEKQWIEQQIHPNVRQRIKNSLVALTAPVVVVVVPLLIEAKMTDLTTEIWVVFCSPEAQLARVMARDGLSEAEARSRINSQMPLTEKIAYADVIIDNSGTVEELEQQIIQALEKENE